MSTSPSWFDQEKLSRLVKKVGTKPVTEILPNVHLGEPDSRPASEGLASTARISLVSKPPSLLSEQRALPALPRRTGTLPTIKALFAQSNLAPGQPVTEAPTAGEPTHEEHAATHDHETVIPSGQEEGDLTEIWHKMSLLNEELARTVLERDQAQNEIALLREQLNRADEESKTKEGESAPAVPSEDLAKLTKERDEAIDESSSLRAQLLQAKESKDQEPVKLGDTQEVTILTGERDQARRQYSDLRKQYEALKQEQAPKEETVKYRKEWEQQLEDLKKTIAERDKEIATLKAAASATGNGDERLKQEAASLREQLARVKDEASVAQRGLALSQKALQQTRDTLREATEGTSLSRHNFDNLKNECAILAQQNTVLQAQNDQLSRDLNTVKTKPTTRLNQ